MAKLFHMTVWGKDSNAPNGYKCISAHTVEAIDGLNAAKKIAAWSKWDNEAWMANKENNGRPEIIIRNETPE